MLISTIILNWNRSYLLQKCVDSYFATAGQSRELFVIDNASTDDSREYLRSLERRGNITVLYLDENQGGEAFNLAIPKTSGEFIHLCENDQILLPGWFEHTLEAFEIFPDLGQLSLFSDVPTDNEAWAPKPSHLKFQRGKILYEAHGNVGTSSVLRGTLFRDRKLQIFNLVSGAFKFPDDRRLTSDVKQAGYWVGWSDRYYVRNVGHEVGEFDSNQSYYEQNYANKPWVGTEGWQERIGRQRRMPKSVRRSVALPDRSALPEKTRQPVGQTPSRVWSMFDGYTAEVEVLDFLFALVRLIKPYRVLETGTWIGLSACAIGRGLLENGFGRLTTLEVNAEAHACALQNLASYKVGQVVEALLQSSMDFSPVAKFDMVIFDSELRLRIEEFRRFRPWLNDGGIVLFHDTAPHHEVVGAAVANLIREGQIAGLDLPTPRGLFIGKVLPSTIARSPTAK